MLTFSVLLCDVEILTQKELGGYNLRRLGKYVKKTTFFSLL